MNGLILNGWKPLDFYTVTRSRIDSRLTSPLNTLVRKGSIHRQSCLFRDQEHPCCTCRLMLPTRQRAAAFSRVAPRSGRTPLPCFTVSDSIN